MSLPWGQLLLLCSNLSFCFGLSNDLSDTFIRDVLEVQETNQCDLSYVTDHTNPKLITDLVELFSHDQRAFLIQTATDEVQKTFHTESKCIVHFIDIDNITTAKKYLKHAWEAGLTGYNNIYVVNVNASRNEPKELMFPDIFDFQRLFLAKNLGTIRQMMIPNEFSGIKTSLVTRGIWSSKSGFDSTDIFTKGYNYLQGNDVIILIHNASSIFGVKYWYPDKTSVLTGTDYFTALYFEQALKFKLRLKMLGVGDDAGFGMGKVINKTTNSYDGFIGMVQRKEAHLAMGGIVRNTARETVVDFSYQSFTTRFGFVTKKPQPLPKFYAVWWPFDNDLWISVFMSLVLFSLGYWCLSKLDKKGFRKEFNFGKALAQTLRILMMKGIVKWPTSWKGKALLTGWVMYALIVDWAYIGNLVASLTKPARTKALDTFEDTLDLPEEASVVVPYGNQAIIQFMKGTSDPILKAVNKKAQVTRHHDIPIKYGGRLGSRWVNWILKSSTPVVYITNIDYMKITLGAAFAKQSGETDLHFSKDRIYPMWFCYALREKAPFMDLINKWTMRSAEFGLFDKWLAITTQDFYRWRFAMKKIGYPVVGTEEVEFSDTPKIEKLEVKHLQFPLIILAVSLAIATIVWIGEICLSKSRLRRVKKRNNRKKTNRRLAFTLESINSTLK